MNRREMSNRKEIDKLMALISFSFKKIYKPTNYTCRLSSNTSRANQDNSPRINRGTGYDNQRAVNIAGARENVGGSWSLNAEQADWKDDTDDESDDQELEAHYMYMAQLQEVTPDSVDNSGPIFDDEPMHKDDQDEIDDLDQEHDLLASLIQDGPDLSQSPKFILMALPSCLMPMVLISKSTATVLSTTMEGIHHHWLSRTSRLSLRTTKFRDRVELATR
ncbi:hypothetical protein Tco_0520627 [Tanacetum coccineum]